MRQNSPKINRPIFCYNFDYYYNFMSILGLGRGVGAQRPYLPVLGFFFLLIIRAILLGIPSSITIIIVTALRRSYVFRT